MNQIESLNFIERAISNPDRSKKILIIGGGFEKCWANSMFQALINEGYELQALDEKLNGSSADIMLFDETLIKPFDLKDFKFPDKPSQGPSQRRKYAKPR